MKVIMIAACSADGFISRVSREGEMSTTWTSQEDKRFYLGLVKDIGLMIMGNRTFQTIGHGLPGRHIYVYTNTPDKLGGIAGVQAVSGEPAVLLANLRADGHERVALCGGASVYRLFMQAGLVDELYLTVEPLLFGAGTKLFDQEIQTQMSLLEIKPLNGNTLLLHYAINN